MARTLERVVEQATKLPTELYARLAHLLVESLEADELGRIDRLWAVEGAHRRDEVRVGCDAAVAERFVTSFSLPPSCTAVASPVSGNGEV